jgi:hypothetical protein
MGDGMQDGGNDGEEEAALLELVPSEGTTVDSEEIRRQLGWDPSRYAAVRRRLEERRRLLSESDGMICRDLTAVPPEFRPACGHPGARVTVLQVPVTVRHAACDLTGVIVSVPGRGGATVPARPGTGIGSSKGIQLEIDARTRDVTIRVTSGSPGNA